MLLAIFFSDGDLRDGARRKGDHKIDEAGDFFDTVINDFQDKDDIDRIFR